mmetsp:Transcript_10492/g.20138  ORF Transcript_10492/g.20138 Transcript_10492/m.20138 type:complete len:113 (-) Transcript_10492:670-1008(-)|eukprot:CAMPEP_0170193080 /NCGR_PEP_ID=MMETSP0040_2-20121228/56052_1 /TAXON_ID=641309 /ORGANISM="Lotharella oceanica, Strain CCMP622" /LENGTH=112 /DNA_ID=CAMNT_0010441623 /DNA_START=169 /DNA_END=507 /DNA_ORIENTATION=+
MPHHKSLFAVAMLNDRVPILRHAAYVPGSRAAPSCGVPATRCLPCAALFGVQVFGAAGCGILERGAGGDRQAGARSAAALSFLGRHSSAGSGGVTSSRVRRRGVGPSISAAK